MITELGVKADPQRDIITIDGKPVDFGRRKIYVLLYKPKGYTSTSRDPHAAKLITDLVKDIGERLYPVGRLDKNSEGLIILTNDGDFAFRITHPRYHVPKTYRVEIKGLITEEEINKLRSGIVLDDGITQPAIIEKVVCNPGRQTSTIDITIHEGRKRQVRRMFDALGHPVLNLCRIKIGNIEARGLKPGKWRFLQPHEVEGLLALAR